MLAWSGPPAERSVTASGSGGYRAGLPFDSAARLSDDRGGP
jgi:hypothetical protein